MGELKVGFNRTRIDPMLGIGIAGYYKPRMARGILDHLEANIIAAQKDDKTVILASLDTISVQNEFAAEVREMIEARTGVPAEAVFLTATHTHTGPYIGIDHEGVDQEKADEYTAFLKAKVADGAVMAIADLKKARMGFGVARAPGISFVRRYLMKDGSVRTNPGVFNPDVVKPLGAVDDEVGVIRFDREGGTTIVVANFACHPDTIGGEQISADWPGEFRRTFERAVEGTKCVFFNGMEGDVNHVKVGPTGGDMNDVEIDFDDVPRGYGHARYMGRCVAGAVLQVYDKVEYTDVASVNFMQRVVDLPSNMPTPEEAKKAHEIVALHDKDDDLLPYKGMELTTVVAEAERMVDLEHGPESFPMLVSAVAIGDIAFIGVPGEAFNPIGVAFKKAPGWRSVFPCCLTNGEIGYFPMLDSYEEGGYESRSSIFKAGVGERIIEEGLKTLADMR